MNQNLETPSWRTQLLDGKPLDLIDGETVKFKFQSEGEEWNPNKPGIKPAVLFYVQPDEFYGTEIQQRLFVRSKELLRQIEALGERLMDIEVKLTRDGQGLETKWVLERV
jgi:hypothetical protein